MTLASILERTGLRWLLGGGVVVGLAGLVLGETLLRPAYEVLHSGALSFTYCAPVAQKPACTFKYGFSIGNTGKQKQDSVRIVLPAELPQATVGTKVSDIVASARKTAQPRVQQESAAGSTVFTIIDLEPNTVMDIDLSCALCDPADLDAFRGIRARVEARGSVKEADPRVSTFNNALMNLLRLVGLFR